MNKPKVADSLQPRTPLHKTWYLVLGIWLTTLVVFLVQTAAPHALSSWPVAQHTFLWPLEALSILFFLAAMQVLFSSNEDPLLAHYASLDSMNRLQRFGLLSFLSLPLLGGGQLALLYPLYLAQQSPHPFLGITHSLTVYAILSLFLWSQATRWLAFGTALSLAVGLGYGGVLWKGAFPAWNVWAIQFLSLLVPSTLILLMMGLTLRWWRRAKSQHSTRTAAHGLVLCVLLSQGFLLFVDSSSVRKGVLLLTVMLLASFLTWASLKTLRETRRLLSFPHTLPPLHCRPYILGSTLPLALWVGLGGWTLKVTIVPSMLLWLAGAQLLAFSGFSTLHSIHRIGWGEPHPIWVFLRPILIFLILFFPFGFPALTLLKAWSP